MKETTSEDLRALDAEIAIAYFGYRWWTTTLHYPGPVYKKAAFVFNHKTGAGKGWTAGRDPEAILTNDFCSGVPHYSTRMEEAWKVALLLHSQGWDVECYLDQAAKPMTIIHKRKSTTFSYVDTGETMAEAICRAALKVKANEEKK